MKLKCTLNSSKGDNIIAMHLFATLFGRIHDIKESLCLHDDEYLMKLGTFRSILNWLHVLHTL